MSINPDAYYYLPQSNGGMIRKKYNKMTANERAYIVQVIDKNPRNTADRQEVKRLTEELLGFKPVSEEE